MLFIKFAIIGLANVAVGTQSDQSTVEIETNIEKATETLEHSYVGKLFAKGLTQKILNERVDAFLSQDPSHWDDQYLTKEMMEAFVTLRSSVGETPERRNLMYRELVGSFPQTEVTDAWSQIEHADYNSGIIYQNDAILVNSSNGICYIIAQASNEGADWWDNFDFGKENILSMKRMTMEDKRCGCADERWYGCASYKSCPVYYSLGSGYDGFTKAYNAMRHRLWRQIQSVCSSSDVKLFSGYSRGG